jgi:cytochrome P450
LDKYIVAFGKGSRNCIGMHLAYAQLYMSVAAVAARYNLEMYGTDDSDATPTRDLFTAGVKLDSQGIRVIVHDKDENVS